MTSAERTEQVREETAIRALSERLAKRFPERAAVDIATAVSSHYQRFSHAPIRDFIPVLVERAVRDDLSHTAPRHA